ncbi:MAG: CPBP family intramembrane metalloprotease [Peptococcaceae bacterium]|jgi:membrane protease YdiL (CAAX protease family)|nr:CPBP family intramembrane metalloprotease [Peptococcaceae bacterium]
MEKKLFSQIGFVLFTVMAIAAALQLALMYGLPILTGGENSAFSSSWVMWLTTFVPLYLVAVPVGQWRFGRIPSEPRQENRLGAGNFLSILLICFPIMYGGNIVGFLLSYVLSGGTAENGLLDYIFDANPMKVVVVVILAPIIEEYIFRKQIIDRSAKYGEKPAIFFSAAAFALFHGNLLQFFYAFGLGLVFAYVYTRTGRLRYSIALHAIINFMGSVVAPWVLSFVDLEALTRMGAANPGDISAYRDIIPGLLIFGLYGLLLLGLSVTGLVLLIVKSRKLVFLPAAEEIQKGRRFRTVYLNPGVILYVLLCLGIIVFSLL